MKKALLLIIFLFSCLHSANAQWYHDHCGVTDINNCTTEEFKCLWEYSSRLVITGSILTGIGTGCIIGGIIIELNNLTFMVQEQDSKSNIGGYLFWGGVIIDLIAIPMMSIGFTQKGKLKHTPNYKSQNLEILNISPTINRNHFNNSYSIGLTATVRF